MELTFLGAAHEVTGSCTLLTVGSKNILIDCGMEQGKDLFVNQALPLPVSELDCVLLTHAHIDHSGKLPLLYKQGYRGPIYATEESCSLCGIMLRDSAHIQMSEAEWSDRKAKRSGGESYEPLYDIDDAEGAISLFKPCRYGLEVAVTDGVLASFTDVGHLLGSAAITLQLDENGEKRTLVFSGDVGNTHQPILKDPQPVEGGDYLVIESTYGDRLHEPSPDYIAALGSIIQRVLDRGGNVIIPSFAVGRTQELLYFLRAIRQRGLVKGHPNFPVYVDSPLANEATRIFQDCPPEVLDEDCKKLISQGVDPLNFDGLKLSKNVEESKALNDDKTPKVILAASGMCEAGRIRHHLKHNLWRPESLILFVGYQAAGTLGRALVDGARSVKLFGETIAVRAEIAVLAGVSGHADRDGLVDWVNAMQKNPSLTFVNHSENETTDRFAQTLSEVLSLKAVAPYSGSRYDLISGEVLYAAKGIPIDETAKAAAPKAKVRSLYDGLITAAERLVAIARACQGSSNRDLTRFTEQIRELCERWK